MKFLNKIDFGAVNFVFFVGLYQICILIMGIKAILKMNYFETPIGFILLFASYLLIQPLWFMTRMIIKDFK